MKKYLLIAMSIMLAASSAMAQETARPEALTMDVRQSSSLTVNHKAYSAIEFNGVVTDSVANASVDISGKTGTIGFKQSLSATNFFAEIALTITNGPAGEFTAVIPSAQWATNILVKTRFYGDVRLSDFGNTLPSIDLWLYPSANSGTETTYVSPTTAGFETNGVFIEDLSRIDFSTGFTSVFSSTGGVNRLTLTTPASDVSALTATQALHTIQIGSLTTTQAIHTTEIGLLTTTQIVNSAKNSYPVADSDKLAGIEVGADVTDTDNVTGAGALMDSEVDSDLKTFALPPNTTISPYGATLVDDADAGTARATLGAGTGDGDFLADGSVPMTGDLNGGGNNATNFALIKASSGAETTEIANGNYGIRSYGANYFANIVEEGLFAGYFGDGSRHVSLCELGQDALKVSGNARVIGNITAEKIDTVDSVDGLLINSLNNTSDAVTNVVGALYTVINNEGYWGGLGMTSTGSTISAGAFINTLHLYNQGYGDTLYTVDGNKDHVWYTNPSDTHDFSALTNEVMRLSADGDLTISGTVDGIDIATDVAANTTHRTSDGTDHTYIDQDVRSTASPTFAGITVDKIFFTNGGTNSWLTMSSPTSGVWRINGSNTIFNVIFGQEE